MRGRGLCAVLGRSRPLCTGSLCEGSGRFQPCPVLDGDSYCIALFYSHVFYYTGGGLQLPQPCLLLAHGMDIMKTHRQAARFAREVFLHSEVNKVAFTL